MSYCVHCGVELDPTASVCPLCQTLVQDPAQAVDRESPKPFPTRAGEIKPVSKWELTLLVTTILVSVSVVCGVLNIFLNPGHIWSLYIIGAALMLWLWFVPPLLDRKLALPIRLLLDVAAIAIYVLLIAVANDGMSWYLYLAVPIILTGGAIAMALGLFLPKRSILSTTTTLIGSVGLFCFFLELYLDRYLQREWTPSWSLVVVAICVAIVVPLIIVRRVPSLREEVRRRFHM